MVYDVTMLNKTHVYEIGGTFYRFMWEEPKKLNESLYHFRPHGNQRKKSDLVLNRQKLLTRVNRIEGMTISGKHDEVIDGNIQLSLF